MCESDYKRVVNDILVEMFNDILRVERRAIGTEDMPALSMSELHVIEAVGDSQGTAIMSEVAKKLRITLPTLTAAVDRLEEKGYLSRRRSVVDRRRISMELTADGMLAYRRHALFHESMVSAFLKGMDQAKMPELIDGMRRLRDFFKLQIEPLEGERTDFVREVAEDVNNG